VEVSDELHAPALLPPHPLDRELDECCGYVIWALTFLYRHYILKNGVFWDVTPCGSCGFLQEPHGVTSQKKPFFIVTAVKTSNLIH
jgi:hypothetical protein